jgi:hypothetical protein
VIHALFGEQVAQVEQYFITRVRAQQVRPERATQVDNIREWRWWGLGELARTGQTVYPVGLAGLSSAYLTGGTSAKPIRLPG